MEDFEEFEYWFKSVKEIFIEMKNIVEFMVDFVYSVVFFNDKEIVEEVLDLEERMDFFNYYFMIYVVFVVRNFKEVEQIILVFQMVNFIEDIFNVVGDFVKMVFEGFEFYFVIMEVIFESEEIIVKIQVKFDFVFVGRILGELVLVSNIGVWIIVVRRGKRWIIVFDGDFKIKFGDVLIGRGIYIFVEYLKEIVRGVIRVVGDERV